VAVAESYKPWANRVLDIFGQDNERYTVTCVGCRSSFGTAQGLRTHLHQCSGQPGVGPSDAQRDAWAKRAEERDARKRDVRANTIPAKQLTKRFMEAERRRDAEAERFVPVAHLTRPRTRGECEAVARPCPFVSCRYHLYLDVTGDGSIKLNFPDLEPDELVETCALDVADTEGESLEVVGELMNITRERIRQLESKAIERLHKHRRSLEIPRASDFEHPDDRVRSNTTD